MQAIAVLGIPMVLLSWFLFSWMFELGDLNREDSRQAINSRVKELKKNKESLQLVKITLRRNTIFLALKLRTNFSAVEISHFHDQGTEPVLVVTNLHKSCLILIRTLSFDSIFLSKHLDDEQMFFAIPEG